jgi:hypothetical protein
MNYDQLPGNTRLPAPCILNRGIIVNPQDIQKVIGDLHRVRYVELLDGQTQVTGEAYIQEVFAEPLRSTILANHTLYLNIQSFDYLKLEQSEDEETYFDLVQDNRILRLIPLSNPLQNQPVNSINTAALEVMMAEVLAANLDVQMDDDDPLA